MVKKRKNELSLHFKVERSNDLNQLSPRGLSLTEIRFLAIYQAKINARNLETRTVTFPLAEFCKIMEIHQLTVTYIKRVADSIICKPIHLTSKKSKDGFIAVPLFTKCEVYRDDIRNEWLIDIKCSEEVLPYMFEMKRNYFTYELWNALKLKSLNQLRMYEILKQYEKIGERTITLDSLKNMLGINKGSQSKYQDFRRDVLEVCQRALEQYTDIKYTFEPIRNGRKICALRFIITKNKNFKDDLRLKEFIKPEDLEDIKGMPINDIDNPLNVTIESLYYRCNEAYTIGQLEMLYNYVESSGIKLNVNTENYIYSVYCQTKIEGSEIGNLFKYTFAIIKNQMNEYIFNVQPVQKEEPSTKKSKKEESSIDLEEWKMFTSKYPRRMSDEECFYVLDDFDNTIGYVFERDFNKISDGTWRELNDNFKNGHLSSKSDLGRTLMSLKKSPEYLF